MSDVFISYSRKDIAFAKLIREALQASDLDTWIDWERIPIGENWWKEICEAIENANVFMFIISRNSIGSAVCRDEINQALTNHKRIIPLIVDNLTPAAVMEFAPDLPQINWIAFEQDHNFQIRENPDVISDKPEDRLVALPRLPQFQDALARLSKAIHLDWEWVKYHTSLQVEARRWETLDRNPDYLLRGAALETAESRLLSASRKDPAPSAIQVEFITSSRQEESHRQLVELHQQEEKLRLEQKARARQRLASWAIGIGLVIAIILGIFGWTQRNQYLDESQMRATAQFVAEEQRDIATARQLAAQSGMRLADRLDVSLLLAVQSSKIKDTSEGRTSLAAGLQAHPGLQSMLQTEINMPLMSMAISPDDHWIAAGGWTKQVAVWDASTNFQILEPLTGFSGFTKNLVFTSDSKILIAQDMDGNIQYWDTSNWKLIRQFQDKSIQRIFRHPANDQLFITIESGGIVAVRDFTNTRVIQKIAVCNAAETIINITIHPSGQKFAATCGNYSLQLWSLTSGKSISSLISFALLSFTDLTFNPAGNLLAFSGQKGSVNSPDSVFWLWDIEKSPMQPENILNPLTTDGTGQVLMAFSPDGKLLATGRGKTVRFWSTSTSTIEGKPLTGSESNIAGLVFSRDGKKLLASGSNSHLFVWNPEERHSIIKSEVEVENVPNYVAFTSSSDKPILVDAGCGKLSEKAECLEGEISLTQFTNGKPLRESMPGTFAEVTSIATHPNSRWLASTHKDGSLNLWELAARKLAHPKLESPGFIINGMDLSPDDRWLATGGQEGTLHLWDLSQTPPTLNELRKGQKEGGLTSSVYGVKFTPDGRSLVEVGSYIINSKLIYKILVWDTQKRSVKLEIPFDAAFFMNNRAAFSISANNKMLALALFGYIKIFDLENGKVLASPTRPDMAQITFLTFSRDGKWIATVANKTITLWDAASLQVVTRLDPAEFSPSAIAFSPDGKTLAHTGVLGEVSLWDVSVSGWQAAACRIANRNLTHDEWQNYLPGTPYQKTCPELP